MKTACSPFNRRHFLAGVGAGAAACAVPAFFTTPGAFAQELVRTPRQTEGPFYPDRLPLDTDNDLLVINNAITPAVGDVTHLTGRIRDARGNPVRNATVEIWQVDNRGAYLHTRSGNRDNRDANFQGFGRFLTASSGEYYFRTIKPVPYPGRTPHIHFKVKIRGREDFTTQCYIRGERRNENDGILNAIRDRPARESLIVEFAPIPESRINELSARFDIILGFTPGEDPAGDAKKK
ncbi:MAG: intradiol ring-cleavage dioxygenase [Planctomycetes bacterium]|nr:intradiol ring-cleavage dioxygenase [Planctomycetota bacterium]